MIKSIQIHQITEVRAVDVKPGMITLDGVVLGVEFHTNRGTHIQLTHRNVTYIEPAGKKVQIYARLSEEATRITVEAYEAEREQIRDRV